MHTHSLWGFQVLTPSIMSQELEDSLKSSAEEFKEFERQDLKYREDLKHMKQKLKKIEEKIEKVRKASLLNFSSSFRFSFFIWTDPFFWFVGQH